MTRYWLASRLALVLLPLIVLVGGVMLGADVLHAVVVAFAALLAMTFGLGAA